MKYKRIIIIGSAGSGKSYLAKKIAEATGYPLIHLDNEFWKPGWIETPRDEWIEKQKKLIDCEKWIIEGNYDSTLEMRFKACDAVIFLDINRFVCIYGAIKRHGRKRSDLPDYCAEKYNKDFFDFLKWIWNFPKRSRNKIFELHEQYSDKPFFVIKRRQEGKKFYTIGYNWDDGV